MVAVMAAGAPVSADTSAGSWASRVVPETGSPEPSAHVTKGEAPNAPMPGLPASTAGSTCRSCAADHWPPTPPAPGVKVRSKVCSLPFATCSFHVTCSTLPSKKRSGSSAGRVGSAFRLPSALGPGKIWKTFGPGRAG